ncbi:integrase catalytic domain-containing protein [Trichonephila clavipes]|nr:integrase catalytic domain-containing protein [Trichonephila clavipes]
MASYSGSANPADLVTRGVSSSTLLTSIGLCGPKFLHETFPIQTDSSVPSLNDAVPEERYCALQSTIVPNHLPDVDDSLHKFSSLSKLKRVTTYCLRFINNCRNSNDKIIGLLKTSELINAMYILIKSVQIVGFNNEINALKGNQSLSCRSKILSLNPFLDCSNILRVGGRLRHANLAYGHKHPILLPKRHILTDLIVRHYHEILLHAGRQLVQSCIQEQYWIIGTRAIHLELVTDLSADAFIAALKRFISRRGKCSDIYSDCGSNFVGAKRKLMEFEKLAKSDNYNQNVSKFLTDNGIKWHQNVPGAPHMGGLWEAGISQLSIT